MLLLTELEFCFEHWLQRCRAYGAIEKSAATSDDPRLGKHPRCDPFPAVEAEVIVESRLSERRNRISLNPCKQRQLLAANW